MIEMGRHAGLEQHDLPVAHSTLRYARLCRAGGDLPAWRGQAHTAHHTTQRAAHTRQRATHNMYEATSSAAAAAGAGVGLHCAALERNTQVGGTARRRATEENALLRVLSLCNMQPTAAPLGEPLERVLKGMPLAAWLHRARVRSGSVWAWGDIIIFILQVLNRRRYGAWCNAVDAAADDGQKHQGVNVLRRTLCRTVSLQTSMQWQHATYHVAACNIPRGSMQPAPWQHATCPVQLEHRIQRDSAHFATAPLLT